MAVCKYVCPSHDAVEHSTKRGQPGSMHGPLGTWQPAERASTSFAVVSSRSRRPQTLFVMLSAAEQPPVAPNVDDHQQQAVR